MPEETDGFVEVRENEWTRRDAAVKTQARKRSGIERIGRDGHRKKLNGKEKTDRSRREHHGGQRAKGRAREDDEN